MINKLKITLSTIVIFIIFSCNENPYKPKEDSEKEDVPGKRDYEWTIDTLNIYSPVTKIWGSSPTDVWCINESDFEHSIWHFDGKYWTTDNVYRFISPHALYGFSYNEIYIGGLPNGQIWRFDGNSWNQIASLTKEGTDFVAFENIWGESPDDFYAVGNGPDEKLYANYTVIAHFINNKWNMFNTNDLKGDVVHLYKNKYDNKIYFRLTKIGGTEHIDSTIIYEYIQGRYNKIYSSPEVHGLQADISFINEEVYFILGNIIAKRFNNQFQTQLTINNPKFYQRIWGRNSKDIFLLMTDGLAHYNGNNIEYLFYFRNPNTTPWTQIIGAAIFKEEVFFTVYEPPTDLKLIYHGKLKEE